MQFCGFIFFHKGIIIPTAFLAGASGDRLKISNIVVNPYPAIKGQLVNISLTAVVSSPIDQLNAEIDSLFVKKHYNLCDPQFSKYVNCPVQAGNLFVQISEPVPQVPISKATAKVFLRDSQGVEVSCTIIYLQFK